MAEKAGKPGKSVFDVLVDVDWVAENVVLTDADGAATWATVRDRLKQVAAACGGHHAIAGRVRDAVTLADGLAGGRADAGKARELGAVVADIQQKIRTMPPVAPGSPAPAGARTPAKAEATPIPRAPAPAAAAPAAPATPAGDGEKGVAISDAEMVREFIAEAQEHFDNSDHALVTLEQDPANAEAINAVFRAFHTIKGACGFLELDAIAEVAHTAENLLAKVRSGQRAFVGHVVEVTFAALDMLKRMIADLDEAQAAGRMYYPTAARHLLLQTVRGVLAEPAAGAAPVVPPPPVAATVRADPEAAVSAAPAVPRPLADAPARVEPEATGERPGEPARTVRVPVSTTARAATLAPADEIPAPQLTTLAATAMMKIDAEKVDLLIDTIGELVIAESIVERDPELRAVASARVERNLTHLGKITRQLQDMGMAMRMVPLDATFRRMSRLVRDIAHKAGKEIALQIEGGDTELDRGIVERLSDPLVHLIRNAIDHGVESESERAAAGKRPVGTVTLRASHQGGKIHVEVSDDGRGLDRERIVAKALRQGLIDRAEGMSDQEVFALIFLSGFSTKEQATELSGRGVGMDVVKRDVEAMRGTVLIQSELGVGTRFTLVLPLTTAIIDGMGVRVGAETYILPLLGIVQSFRPTRDQITRVLGRGTVVRFRERLVPVIALGRLFKVPAAVADPCAGTLTVVEDAGRQVALLVDELIGQQQTVIKRLSVALGEVQAFSGVSILANGQPGLILDVAGLVVVAHSTQAEALATLAEEQLTGTGK